jgi:hypothetical protein
VLDNLHTAVMPWRRTGYGWMMRSEAGDPRLWQAIERSPVARVATKAAKSSRHREAARAAVKDASLAGTPEIVRTSLAATEMDRSKDMELAEIIP